MAKGNIRSIRFSDEMVELINQQVGDTFTARFETLVTKCVWALPRKEEELAAIRKQIKQEQQKLQKLERLNSDLERMTWTIESVKQSLSTIDKQAAAIADCNT